MNNNTISAADNRDGNGAVTPTLSQQIVIIP